VTPDESTPDESTPPLADANADPGLLPPLPLDEDSPPPPPPLEEDQSQLHIVVGPSVSIYESQEGAAIGAVGMRSPQTRYLVAAEPKSGVSRVPILCNVAGYSATVFVALADAVPVVTRYVQATTKSGTEPTRVGVYLSPGTIVKIKRTRGEKTRVHFDSHGILGTGWIPKSALGTTYVESDADLPKRPWHELSLSSRAVDVKAKPKGSTLVRVDRGLLVQTLGSEQEGHILVAVGARLPSGVYVIGWIPKDATGPFPPGGVLGGMAPTTTPEQYPQGIEVPKWTNLISESGDQIVGATQVPTLMNCVEDCATNRPLVQLECVARFRARVQP